MPDIKELYPIPDEVKKFYTFLGDWDVEGKLEFDNNIMKIQGTWTFTKAAGGWGIKSSNGLEIEDLGHYELDNLFGFDRETGELHIYSLTNMAETHDHKAVWTDDNTLNGDYEGLKDGKKFREDFTLKIVNSDEITIDYVEKIDDELESTMNIRLKRKK